MDWKAKEVKFLVSFLISTVGVFMFLITTLAVSETTPIASTATNSHLKRLAGADRYVVSAAISKEIDGLGIHSNTIVIARGDLYADALSGGPLAGLTSSPILLTQPSALPSAIQTEIKRRNPTKAIILGGIGAVSTHVEQQLKSLGITTIERISGADRYVVTASIAEKVTASKTVNTAIVVSGLNFPDALSASSIAAQRKMPILLVNNAISASIQSYIHNHTEIKNFIIIGGPAAVSDTVATQLGSYGTVTRIGGADRFEVSVNIANYFKMSTYSSVFTNGEGFADALSGAPLAAYTHSPIILTYASNVPFAVANYYMLKQGEFEKGYILGGTAAVSTYVEETISSWIKELHAFWVDMFHDGAKTPAQVAQLIKDAQTAHVNAIFVQIRRRGDAYYNDSIEPRTEDPALTPGYDPLQDLIQKAHASTPRIEIHVWFAMMPIWNQPTPPTSPNHVFNLHGPSQKDRNMWLSKNSTGGFLNGDDYVIDPGHPDAVNYTIDVIKHVANNYNIDGVHMDLVRYMGSDWGYNPTSVARFNQRYGRTGNPDPNDATWKAWRREQVNQLVQKVYVNLMEINPNLDVSAATIAWGDGPKTLTDYQATPTMNEALQDWNQWLQNGWIDFTVPMDYFRQSDSTEQTDYTDWLNWEKDHQYGRRISAGVGVHLNSINGGLIQIHQALQPSAAWNHLEGVNLYSYAVTNKDGTANSTFYSSLSQSSSYDTQAPAFADYLPAPTLPWKIAPTVGHLAGHVTHSDATTSDGETVTITGPESRTVITDGSGDFEALNLKPGDYTVKVGSTVQTVTIVVNEVTRVTMSE